MGVCLIKSLHSLRGLVFLDGSLQLSGQDKHFFILLVVSYTYTELYVQTMQMLEGIIADFIFGTFSVHMHLTVLELARAGEEEEERKKDERFFFQTSRFLRFYKAELKSEDKLYSGWSGLSVDIYFVGFYLCFEVLGFCSPIINIYQPPPSLHRDCYCKELPLFFSSPLPHACRPAVIPLPQHSQLTPPVPVSGLAQTGIAMATSGSDEVLVVGILVGV